ncbi:signal peptidase I [Periweissella fabalis]|uniref:Signal peptidase I n=1 Tax=Periweissella fabalis TaxID=1070421 RepID=A0A7X6S2L5_9LACO|nr:signal peptidase I [Periweissella fabalis]MCM0599379.1 signal peptidase I [Periweissella fabalis]NKZ23658.1 signal peptidase I [Periweissella fabalis]
MKGLKKVLEWVIPIVIGVAIAFFVKDNFLSVVKVDGTSMQPNLQNRQSLVLLHKAQIKHDSVVVFDAKKVDPQANDQNIDYVKRVIGLPGDSIRYSADGKLFINNKQASQSYISKDQQNAGTLNMLGQSFPGFTLTSLATAHKWTFKANSDNVIPKGYYFVMGDHRSVSNDSRYWGLVPRDQILGVVKAFPWQAHHQIINSYQAN